MPGYICAESASHGSTAPSGMCFAGTSLVPTSIFLNGEKCILVNVGGQTIGLNSNGTAGKESVEQPLSLSGPNIIGTDGNVVSFQGLNWFGFEVSIPDSKNVEVIAHPYSAHWLSLLIQCGDASRMA